MQGWCATIYPEGNTGNATLHFPSVPKWNLQTSTKSKRKQNSHRLAATPLPGSQRQTHSLQREAEWKLRWAASSTKWVNQKCRAESSPKSNYCDRVEAPAAMAVPFSLLFETKYPRQGRKEKNNKKQQVLSAATILFPKTLLTSWLEVWPAVAQYPDMSENQLK